MDSHRAEHSRRDSHSRLAGILLRNSYLQRIIQPCGSSSGFLLNSANGISNTFGLTISPAVVPIVITTTSHLPAGTVG
jgi:hypothetical protein